ncbi:MAG: hypothetical protein AAF468_05180 [Pseudomonadota bacterium]
MAVTACQSTSPLDSVSPRDAMTKVARQAQACWFGANKQNFANYRLASEVSSYAGRPRVLIVPKNNPEGLPKLVVQAERRSGTTEVSVFGPLLDGKDGPLLEQQARAWAAGAKNCTA